MAAHDDAVKVLSEQIKKSIEALKQSMTKIRTGRANAAMLDGVRVSYYGTPTPLAQCAAVAVPEPRLITVKPWDKGILKEIEKALLEANLGLTPQNDGEIIRLPIPPLTEQRRKDIVRIPTLEIEAVAFEVKPVVIPVPASPSVALNDSLSVSPELLADGAMTLSAEEVEAIHANTRKVWMVFGGIVGAALALIGVVVMLATQAPTPVVMAPVHPVTKTAAPVAARRALDELTPLAKVAAKAAAPKTSARPAKVETAPVVEKEPAPETAPVPEKSANAADFNFLESAEAPRSELKRPTSEL